MKKGYQQTNTQISNGVDGDELTQTQCVFFLVFLNHNFHFGGWLQTTVPSDVDFEVQSLGHDRCFASIWESLIFDECVADCLCLVNVAEKHLEVGV